MRTPSNALVALVRPVLTAGLLTGLAAVACSSPTATDLGFRPAERHHFACGGWTPKVPPVSRALFDLRLSQIDTAAAPATHLVEAIEAAGGRVVYRFHGPMVRAELHVAAVAGLVGDSFGGPLNSAVTVSDPATHDVSLIVMLTRDLTAADLQAVQALGGRITQELHAIDGYVVVVDDALLPAVRALPGVAFASFNAMGCLA